MLKTTWEKPGPVFTVQIRLYFYDMRHTGGAYGIIRALVKDSSDTSNRASYLDSDGRVGAIYYNNGDSTDQPKLWERRHLADGLWHMITLTTLTNSTSGLEGYNMYLDGRFIAGQTADSLYLGQPKLLSSYR